MDDPANPGLMTVDPRVLAGMAGYLTAGLLLLLFAYRRRTYILFWCLAWGATGTGLILGARTSISDTATAIGYGLGQFVALFGAAAFLVSAWSYRSAFRLRRIHGVVIAASLMWFTLAPIWLGARSVFMPGHLLIGGTLLAAAGAQMLILRRVWLRATAAPAMMLALMAAANFYLALAVAEPFADGAGRVFFVMVAVFLLTGLTMQVMIFEDMTAELRQANHQLETAQTELRELAVTDPLTKCRNRRFFEEVIGRELKRHRRYNIPLSLLFIDINNFKAINDELGHDTGDRVLQEVADFLMRNIREADYVFRWGGDEFLVMWSCREAEAQRRAAALQGLFVTAPGLRSLPPGVGLSMGCVEVPPGANDIVPYVQRADELMYAHKRASR
jgi:diguanylate cyclase (GGDEF)-like protein